MSKQPIRGARALAELAARFPQLYVAPAEDALDAHRQAAAHGMAPPEANLDHFSTSPQDELREVETPAGPVEVLFLENRADFETFLQIIGHKSQPVAISPAVGAITYRGMADWGKVEAARQAYLEEGGDDWGAEFKRLAGIPGSFRSELVVISEGEYSNVPATETPFDRDEWVRLSREIRLHHECAHVVCRRTMPDDALAVWDEVTADAVGLLCALGRYDAELAARFLGVSEQGFAGGRLEEYLDEAQRQHVDETARKVHGACRGLQQLCNDDAAAHPFDFLIRLKREPLLDF